MVYNRERIVNTIEVPFESYLFLQKEMHRQRSETGRPLSEKCIDRLKRSCDMTGGTHTLHDYDLGGCNGDPHHAWEEKRWTNWSCDTMCKMLDKEGLPYERKGKTTVIDVYF